MYIAESGVPMSTRAFRSVRRSTSTLPASRGMNAISPRADAASTAIPGVRIAMESTLSRRGKLSRARFTSMWVVPPALILSRAVWMAKSCTGGR